MEIRGRDYKVSILVMMMEDEYLATKITMASILNSIGSDGGVSVYLLLNGAENKEMADFFSSLPNVTFYSSKENLGVAGGRNYLLTRPEMLSSDIIFNLDNDILIPTDYIRNMCEFLIDHPEAGIVNPVVLWARDFVDFYDDDSKKRPSVSGLPAIRPFKSEELKKEWIEKGNDGESLYYLGTHSWFLTDCMATPTSLENFLLFLKEKSLLKKPPSLLLQKDSKTISGIKEGTDRVKTQTTNGGFQVFKSTLLFQMGLYETGYNPYGHEDHEFSIRSLKAGYTNYACCNTFALHGTDERQQIRGHPLQKHYNARRRTITTRKVCANPIIRLLVIIEILIHTILSSTLHNILNGDLAFKSVRSGVKGWWKGLTVELTDNEKLVEEIKRAKDGTMPRKPK